MSRPQVEYLDYIICVKGVKVDPSKGNVMTHWPDPKIVKALAGF